MGTSRKEVIILFAFIQVLVRCVQSAKGPNITCGLYSVEEYHQHSRQTLEPKATRYIEMVAGNGDTYRWNEEAFRRLQLRNKVLADITKRNLTTTMLGTKVAFPVGIAPAAAHQNACPEGENATARAAASAGSLMVLSLHSTVSMEEVRAAGGPDLLTWVNVQIYSNLSVTLDLIRRGEAVGAKAIVITVDVVVDGYRPVLYQDNYWYPNGSKFANLEKYSNFGDQSATVWSTISRIKGQSRLPIVIKGILTAEDATLAVKYGAQGIIVSNHGARQLDGDPATIDVLPEIVKAVRGKAEVYLDGGIRSGMDIVKALALGARAVFIGRPVFWGLSYQCEVGLKCVLELLKFQLDIAMALTGQTNATAIARNVVRIPTY